MPAMTLDLPIELFYEIVPYLPRHILKLLLLFQPHPLGRIASYTYFSSLTLHFGVSSNKHRFYPESHMYNRPLVSDILERKHGKRSYEILDTIIRDTTFANNVQTLKICIFDSESSYRLTSHIDLLNLALRKLTRLRELECSGTLRCLPQIIDALPQSVPHLKALKLSDCTYSHPGTTSLRIRNLPHLNQLILCSGWSDFLSTADLSGDFNISQIKKLHIEPSEPSFLASLAFVRLLTHLSLKCFFPSSIPLFGIIFECGANLQSLRIETPTQVACAQYFRRYAHAFPHLTEFGIHLTSRLDENLRDTDFFPAMFDFLRPKAAQLVRLEIKVPTSELEQDRLGFGDGQECWSMFNGTTHNHVAAAGTISFPRLECLIMTVPADGRFVGHWSKLIPRGVTRMCLSEGRTPLDELFQESLSEDDHGWPPNLRFVSFSYQKGSHRNYRSLVQKIAENIPTVRVIKATFAHYHPYGFWSVHRSEDGGIVELRKWDPRDSTIMVKETLDLHGCEDTSFEEY